METREIQARPRHQGSQTGDSRSCASLRQRHTVHPVHKVQRLQHHVGRPIPLPLVADRADEFLHRLSIGKVYLAWMTVFYEEQGWPGKTQQEVRALSSKYDEAVTRVHRFNLATMDQSSAEILAELEEMFKRAWDERPTSE